jgi:Tol biopolymer transport system component
VVQRNLTRLTFGPGLQTDVTWSPDGTRIAYTSDRGGNFDIWTEPIGGGDAVQVTKSPASDTQPAWSPDGRSIVFRSEREGGGLFLVPAFGGPERQLTSFGVHPQWSASGTEITFHVASGGSPTNVYRVSPAGGEPPREILQEFLRGGVWDWIAFHPDGRLSAIGLSRHGQYGFFTVSPLDGRVTTSRIPPTFPLAGREMGTRVLQFHWNAEGDAMFVVATVNEVRNLWKVRVEPRTLAWLSAERLTTGMGADVSAALSSDGTRVAFTAQRASVRLWVYPFDAVTGRVTGEGRPMSPEEGAVTSWDLSPDGRRIAYGLKRAGSDRTDLWLTDIDTGASELLAQNGLGPTWSPDGKMIAYNLFRPDRPPPGEWALATRELAGTERVLGSWSTKAVLLPSDWTRDGSAILGSYLSPLYTGRARLALWRRASAAATAPERVLVDDVNANIWQGRYSRDGRWLGFVAQPIAEGERVQLAVVPASGAARERWTAVAPEHRWADKPRWAPDGRTIYFLSGQDSSFFNLWGSRFDSVSGKPVGEPFKITHFDAPGLVIPSDIVQVELGISARRAVLTMANVTGNVWMLDNVDR